jgi:hypothetical protein
MALLSIEDQQKYRLAHGKQYLYVCDGPCGKLIPATELAVVKKWRQRKDGLTFLGAAPTEVRCQTCCKIENGTLKENAPEKHGVAKPKPKKRDMIAGVRRAVLAILETEKPKNGYTSDELILKLRRKASLREYGKAEMKRTFSLMKKFHELKRNDERWRLA